MKFEKHLTIPGSEWLTIVIPGLWTQPSLLNNWLQHVDEKSSLHVFNHFPKTEAEIASVDENGLKCLAELICRHIDTNPHKKYHIVGHSMGGLLAQMVADKLWSHDIKVTLISSAPPRGVMLKGLGLYFRIIRAIINGQMLKKSFAPTKPDFQATMFNMVSEMSLSDYTIPAERMRLIWDIVFARIRIRKHYFGRRVRIISGYQDSMIASATCRSLARFHRCEIRFHPGGHLPFIEKDSDEVGKMAFDMSWGFYQ